MAARSTRNKLRWQVEKAMTNIDRAIENLAFIDAVADNRSEYIKTYMAGLVVMLTEVKKVLEEFRTGL